MRKIRCIVKWAPILAVLMFTFPYLALAFQEGEEHKPDKPQYQSSNHCKTCHPGIYKYWSNSMHSNSVSDPVFQIAYARAIASYGVKIREFCLSCHSPTTIVTKDFDLKDPISKEGITCDFCHTVANVIEAKPRNLVEVQLGDTKFGPREGIDPIAGLQFRYSVLHKSSKLCSACHELESENGTKILGTYSEWKESPYAQKGIQCQNCHMPELLDVPVVAPSVKAVSNMAHAHEFLGGHSQIRLEKAASVVTSVKREGDKIIADVYVTNAEAGHCLPSGLPTRKVILTVSLHDENGQVISSQERTYEKTLIDKDGNVIVSAECAMVDGVAIKNDSRIKPKETRHERFQFTNLQDGQSYMVLANLRYKFEAVVLERNVMTVDMASEVKVINGGVGGSSNYEWIILLLGISLLLLVMFIVILKRSVSHKVS